MVKKGHIVVKGRGNLIIFFLKYDCEQLLLKTFCSKTENKFEVKFGQKMLHSGQGRGKSKKFYCAFFEHFLKIFCLRHFAVKRKKVNGVIQTLPTDPPT